MKLFLLIFSFVLCDFALACEVEDQNVCTLFEQYDANNDQKLDKKEALDLYYGQNLRSVIIAQYGGVNTLVSHFSKQIYTYTCKYKKLPYGGNVSGPSHFIKWIMNPVKRISMDLLDFNIAYKLIKKENF